MERRRAVGRLRSCSAKPTFAERLLPTLASSVMTTGNASPRTAEFPTLAPETDAVTTGLGRAVGRLRSLPTTDADQRRLNQSDEYRA
jgi:hypothetical protein